jgi:hypothetical protein
VHVTHSISVYVTPRVLVSVCCYNSTHYNVSAIKAQMPIRTIAVARLSTSALVRAMRLHLTSISMDFFSSRYTNTSTAYRWPRIGPPLPVSANAFDRIPWNNGHSTPITLPAVVHSTADWLGLDRFAGSETGRTKCAQRARAMDGPSHRFVWSETGRAQPARRVRTKDGAHHRFAGSKTGRTKYAQRARAMDGPSHPRRR